LQTTREADAYVGGDKVRDLPSAQRLLDEQHAAREAYEAAARRV
jgi:hypothetical protein